MSEELTNLSGQFDRLPPNSIEAEMCYIASLMLWDDPIARRRIRHLLCKDDFYQADHAEIFSVICSLIDADKAVDAVIVREALSARGILDEIGGTAYLGQILSSVPSAAHAEHYASIVRDRALKRKAISTGNEMLRRMYAPMDDSQTENAIRSFGEGLLEVVNSGSQIKVWTMAEMTDAFVAEKESGKKVAVLTHLATLDRFVGIFAYGTQTIIAARPSMGKSTFARWLAGVWASAGERVGLISLEEGWRKIAGNYLSDAADIENMHLAYEELTEADWRAVAIGRGKIDDLPIFTVDNAVTLPQVLSAYELLHYKYKCRIIITDHLHLVANDTRRFENTEARVSNTSEVLKNVAKKLDVSGITLAQLNRPEKGKIVPNKPCMTDLRASGAIEQNADAILFLHREEYYTRPPEDELTGKTDVIIAKNRNARVGETVLKMEPQYQRFVDDLSGGMFDELP